MPPSMASMRGGSRRSIAAPMSWCPALPPSTARGALPAAGLANASGTGAQTILGGGGYRLALDAGGRLAFHLDGWQLARQAPAPSAPLYRIRASLDAGKAVIRLRGPGRVLGDAGSETCRAKRAGREGRPAVSPSSRRPSRRAGPAAPEHFDGKIEAPCLAAEALPGSADLARCWTGRGIPAAGRLEFRRDRDAVLMLVSGPSAPWIPARGVTGHRWSAEHQLARGRRLRRHPFR